MENSGVDWRLEIKECLFSYGTLQKTEVQIEFGRLLSGAHDVLRGYKLSSIEIKDEAFPVKGEEKYQPTAIASNDETDFIEGTIFEISEAELFTADKYEPDNYQRIAVELESGKRAWIYAAAEIT